MIFEAFGFLVAAYIFVASLIELKRWKSRIKNNQTRIAFFHPFCNDGGGGEKVLWCMVEALLNKQEYQDNQKQCQVPQIAIYSLQHSVEAIALKVKNRFNIDILKYQNQLKIIHITGRTLLLPKQKLTMLCQIFFPMIYCIKCLWKYQPDIFYDTTGFAFTFLPVKLLTFFRTKCFTYVHYPFISPDMIKKIEDRRVDFNNDSSISKSPAKTKVKLLYYKAILFFYQKLRFLVDKIQTNSSWTDDHMKKIWGNKQITKLFPPCSISQLLGYQKKYSSNNIISLAQFRPEKNHLLQIKVVKDIVESLEKTNKVQEAKSIHLFICGSTRGKEDEELLSNLRNEVREFQMEKYITFCVNMSFPDLINKFKECQLGIHSMEAEHFGISIVEMISAGCLVVAHNSAGPKFDIIKDRRYLAQSLEEYKQKLEGIIMLREEDKKKECLRFRKEMENFSEQTFRKKFREIIYEKRIKSS